MQEEAGRCTNKYGQQPETDRSEDGRLRRQRPGFRGYSIFLCQSDPRPGSVDDPETSATL